MKFYTEIIKVIDTNLIFCLVPILLTLVLVEAVFKNRFQTKKAVKLISWIIITYTLVTGIVGIYDLLFNYETTAFIKRASGFYKFSYLVLFLCSFILPLTLLFKKLSTKVWYVILMAFLLKIGPYIEKLVIIITSFHRDYTSEMKFNELLQSFGFDILMITLQGIILALLILGLFEVIKKIKTVST